MTAMCMIWVTRYRVVPVTKLGNREGEWEGEMVEATLLGREIICEVSDNLK